MNDWIEVKERMPPEGEFVVIRFNDNTYEVAKWLDGWVANDGLDFGYGFADEKVTHWHSITAPRTGG